MAALTECDEIGFFSLPRVAGGVVSMVDVERAFRITADLARPLVALKDLKALFLPARVAKLREVGLAVLASGSLIVHISLLHRPKAPRGPP